MLTVVEREDWELETWLRGRGSRGRIKYFLSLLLKPLPIQTLVASSRDAFIPDPPAGLFGRFRNQCKSAFSFRVYFPTQTNRQPTF